MNETVCAIVVTYNRKVLLEQCLDAIVNQTVRPEKIIVIDNASTDGTHELLQEKYTDLIENVRMEKNTGGAGGFYEGIKMASKENYQWVWVMDDDTIPNNNCLEELLNARTRISTTDKAPAFFASAIFGANDECMNVPLIDECIEENGYPAWYRSLCDSLVTICCATFVSVLFNKNAIDKCGLPYREFFIWGDDSEYTFRMNKHFGKGYFVGKSIAIHLRKNAVSLAKDAKDEINPEKIKRLRYYYRNMSMIGYCYGKTSSQTLRNLKILLGGVKGVFGKCGLLKLRIMFAGILESLSGKKKLRRYINEQITD